jgi:hypothetical protein
MTKSKASPLGANIVTVQKGAAAPLPQEITADSQIPKIATSIPVDEPALPETPATVTQSAALVIEPAALLAMKNISVKVDIVTYKKLKRHGGDMDGKTNQAIFTEALALYFVKHNIK